jgi:hypothetical protein
MSSMHSYSYFQSFFAPPHEDTSPMLGVVSSRSNANDLNLNSMSLEDNPQIPPFLADPRNYDSAAFVDLVGQALESLELGGDVRRKRRPTTEMRAQIRVEENPSKRQKQFYMRRARPLSDIPELSTTTRMVELSPQRRRASKRPHTTPTTYTNKRV